MVQFWLWVAFIGMAIAAVIFGLKAFGVRHKEGMEFPLVSFFVVLWAATMYLTMIQGLTVSSIWGQEVYWGRYVDWIVTTPLLLLDLGVIAGARPKLIAGVMGADILMIITGFIATIVEPPNNYLWYVISSGAFLAILVSLWTEYSVTAHRRGRVNKLFTKLRNILVVLWIAYPILWILGMQGFKIINIGLETAIYAILDLCAKVGFGFVLISTNHKVLAQASDTRNIMEAAESYMDSK